MPAERAYIVTAAAALGDRLAAPLAEKARAEAVKCGRHVNILMNAREYDLAREMLAEAKAWSLRAVELEERTRS